MKTSLKSSDIAPLATAIYGTWSRIAGDCGGVANNAEAIELVLDANRMGECGYKEQERLVDRLCAEHGYTKVARLISKAYRLT